MSLAASRRELRHVSGCPVTAAPIAVCRMDCVSTLPRTPGTGSLPIHVSPPRSRNCHSAHRYVRCAPRLPAGYRSPPAAPYPARTVGSRTSHIHFLSGCPFVPAFQLLHQPAATIPCLQGILCLPYCHLHSSISLSNSCTFRGKGTHGPVEYSLQQRVVSFIKRRNTCFQHLLVRRA